MATLDKININGTEYDLGGGSSLTATQKSSEKTANRLLFTDAPLSANGTTINTVYYDSDLSYTPGYNSLNVPGSVDTPILNMIDGAPRIYMDGDLPGIEINAPVFFMDHHNVEKSVGGFRLESHAPYVNRSGNGNDWNEYRGL